MGVVSSIGWEGYDRLFHEINTKHKPLEDAERNLLEDRFQELLGYSDGARWGEAGGFGNETEVVVALSQPPPHPMFANLVDGLRRSLALRIFRKNKGARTLVFQKQRMELGRPVNGEDALHFQRVLAAGECHERGYILHEWIGGPTLEWCHRHRWSQTPLSGVEAQSLVRDLVQGVVVTAWREASTTSGVLWDLRDANFVVEPAGDTHRLVLVDTGNLRHLLLERDNREGQIQAALKRLKAVILRILGSQGAWEGQPRSWKRLFAESWDSSLLAEGLIDFANQVGDEQAVVDAFARLQNAMEEQGLFRPDSAALD
ncbi:MAG: hypothetical protein EP343_04255 [Deltaproteobacteria bacterium]|nr:MAG: hypothetical protein EP343_04255 [Deltaproteobacteria bacterium]